MSQRRRFQRLKLGRRRSTALQSLGISPTLNNRVDELAGL
jgi:hypothetical protein